MKQALLKLEMVVLRMTPMRWIVDSIEAIYFRSQWLWGRIRFGTSVSHKGIGCVCSFDSEIKYPNNLRLGDRVVIGSNVSIGAHSPISMGDDVRISRDAIIETAGLDFSTSSPPYPHISHPISIERGVWIGARAIVLGGVTIGENAVVAAGAVVSKSVPSGQVVAGVPARQIVVSNSRA